MLSIIKLSANLCCLKPNLHILIPSTNYTMNISEKEFQHFDQMAEMLKITGHTLRISIIKLLCENERLSVTEIFTALGIEQAVASHHLRLLKSAGIVAAQKDGKHAYYYIFNPVISKIYELIKLKD